ncbi:hypothetical protein ANN_25903 [Periplaneta americana]|uniref:Uncharacterized protein n=1 Tax=Periplaneta americana TaxID=6978 RepID=A0ABQ8S4G4_PERAM|nr:hypothetical protein ANN_25903 [Periplaneta americana]
MSICVNLMENADYGTSTVLTRYDPCNYDLFTKGGQYGTSTKMDMLMVYDAFQTFGKSSGRQHSLKWVERMEGKELCSVMHKG